MQASSIHECLSVGLTVSTRHLAAVTLPAVPWAALRSPSLQERSSCCQDLWYHPFTKLTCWKFLLKIYRSSCYVRKTSVCSWICLHVSRQDPILSTNPSPSQPGCHWVLAHTTFLSHSLTRFALQHLGFIYFKTGIDLSLLVQMLISSERTHGCSPEPCSPHESENRKWDESMRQKSVQFDPSVRKHHGLNSWKSSSIQQERLTLPWVTLTAVWGLGSVCYSSLTLQPFPVSSHSGKWFRDLVKTESKMDKIHPGEFTQEVFLAGALGCFIYT